MKKHLLVLLLCFSFFLISCEKDYSYESLTGGIAGTWSFTEASKGFTGEIYNSYIEQTGGVKVLHLNGKSANSADNFQLTLYSSDNFTARTYKASLYEVDFLYGGSVPLYHSNPIAGEFSVTLNSFSGTQVTGTFSGIAEDSSATKKSIASGQFFSSVK
ncbi:hypothetical protein BH09BAC2_BH09BAC2_00890 [soil metagenome]